MSGVHVYQNILRAQGAIAQNCRASDQVLSHIPMQARAHISVCIDAIASVAGGDVQVELGPAALQQRTTGE